MLHRCAVLVYWQLIWCERRDSNSHTSRRQNLNLVRLPIPPRSQKRKLYSLINTIASSRGGQLCLAAVRLWISLLIVSYKVCYSLGPLPISLVLGQLPARLVS